MKLTVGNIRLIMVLGCVFFWVAAGIIGYYTYFTIRG